MTNSFRVKIKHMNQDPLKQVIVAQPEEVKGSLELFKTLFEFSRFKLASVYLVLSHSFSLSLSVSIYKK